MKSLPVVSTLSLLAVLSSIVARPSLANEYTHSCSFNGGTWTPVRIINNGPAFTYTWADGPQMTYVFRGSMADRWNITDKLGGRWQLFDYRNSRDTVLTNLDNGNKIRCSNQNQFGRPK